MKFTGLLVLLAVIFAAIVWHRRAAPARMDAKQGKTQALGSTAASKALAGRSATPADLDAFLLPYRNKLDSTLRAAVQITFAKMAIDNPTTSKLGGSAYWPKHKAEPVDQDGQPLLLLMQLRLDQVPELPDFPRTGLLQIFIQQTEFYGANFGKNLDINSLAEQRYFKMVHWVVLDDEFKVLPARRSERLPHQSAQPYQMQFTKQSEHISIGDFRIDEIFDGRSYIDSLEEYAHQHGVSEDSLTDLLGDALDGSGHKLGGYPYFTQEDPRSAEGMELLLQLDSDDSVNMMWGDVGVANFFIAPEDLKRGDFSRVAYSWDCH
jgi:uncharacterized protein YwqG